jgi:fibronectin-binding autotransporter adhesin
VASGATLGGSGSLGGALTVADGGIFAPGNSPGTLTTTSSASFGNSSVLSYEFNGGDTTVGAGVNDLFTGVINLTLDGVLNVNETVVGSFLSASLGDTWRLINYSGSFTNNTLDLGTTPALSGGNAFKVDTSVAGQVNLVVVPETSSAGLLGLTALLTLRRRRRAA